MGNFYNANQPPLDFGYRTINTGGGGGAPRTDPLAKEKYQRAESARLFGEAQESIPNSTPPDDSQTSDTQAAALQADKQNEDTTFSSDKYALALDKSYGVATGNQYRAQQLELEQKTQMVQLENWRMGAMLVKAGKQQEGLDLLNKGLTPDQQFTSIEPTRNGKYLATNVQGDTQTVDMENMIESLVSSTDLFKAQQAWRLHLSTKTPKTEPLQLKTDEVVGANGQVFSTPAIMEVYKQTYGALKQIADDPKSMILLKSTDPAKYNKILVESASIPTPMAWAKEVYGVDITGKAPGRTVPAETVPGGKQGAKVPKSTGWMDNKPDAAQYKGNRIKSSTGDVLISDGTTWLSESEYKQKYQKK